VWGLHGGGVGGVGGLGGGGGGGGWWCQLIIKRVVKGERGDEITERDNMGLGEDWT